VSAIKTVSVKVSNIGSNDNNNTDNILKITVPEGLEFISYPLIDDPALGAFLNGVTEPTADPAGNPAGTIRYGELTYDIKDTSGGITFNIRVRPDSYRFYGDHTVPSPIKAELENSETAGTPIESDFTVGVTGYCEPSSIVGSAVTDYYTDLDVDYLATPLTFYTYKIASGQNRPTYYSQAAYTVSYPVQAELTGVTFGTRGTPNANPEGVSFAGIDGVKNDPAAHKVTFFYENHNTNAMQIRLQLKFTSALGAAPGDRYRAYTATNLEYTSYDGLSGSYTSGALRPYINIVNSGADNSLKVTKVDKTIAPTPYDFGSVTNMLPGYTVLTRFISVNDKGVELTGQNIRYDFPEELNVRGFDLPAPAGTLSTTIFYKKYGDDTEYLQAISATSTGQFQVRINPSMLTDLGDGILRYAYADCGDFPVGFMQGANTDDGSMIFGNLRIENKDKGPFAIKCTVTGAAAAPVEVTSTVSVGPANSNMLMTGRVANYGSTAPYGSVTAGADIPIWATINTYSGVYSGSIQRMKNPVLYAVIPAGLSVNPASIRVIRGSNFTSGAAIDFEYDFRNYTDASGNNPKDVLVIKTKDCNVGQLTETFARLGNVAFGFKYSTNENVGTFSEVLENLIFIGPEELGPDALIPFENMRFNHTNGSGSFTTYDTYDFNGNGAYDDSLSIVASSADGYINVLERKQLVIGAKIKLDTEDDSAYRTYDGTDASKVVFTPGTTADYQVIIENRSDDVVDDLAVYIPVPKLGQNFGTLFQDAVSPWNMKLTEDAVTNGVDAAKFDVAYSENATGANYSTTATYQSVPATAWGNVNMVKVTLNTPLPVGSKTTINFRYDVDVTETEAGTLSGTDNIFNPYYFVDYYIVNGSFPGAKVAANLQLASIQGMVFVDTSKNGIKDGTEDFYTGADVTVTATSASTSTTRTVTTDATGHYSITGLKGANDYVVSFTLPTGYVRTFQNTTALSTVNSDVERTGLDAGKVSGIDTSLDSSRSVNAGYAINAAPVITVNDQTIRADATFTPSVVSIIDDFDGTITYVAGTHVNVNGVLSAGAAGNYTAGTYAVTYHATDSEGLEGVASQKVKINSLPYVVSHDDWTLPVASAPTLQELADHVVLHYDVAGDTVGGATTATVVAAKVTNPTTAPTTVGKYTITIASNSSTIGNIPAGTGNFILTLTAAPAVSATIPDGPDAGTDPDAYASGVKTNQNVTITVTGAPGLTIKYRKGTSGS
jgi:hypothetical protein